MDITGFRIEKDTAPGAGVCLRLHGELDLSVAGALDDALAELKQRRTAAVLDLSAVTFMDSTGLGVVLTAVLDARRDGWRLDVERELTQPVARVVEISGAGPYLWPD
jgi:anti-sigma B factor antagonist